MRIWASLVLSGCVLCAHAGVSGVAEKMTMGSAETAASVAYRILPLIEPMGRAKPARHRGLDQSLSELAEIPLPASDAKSLSAERASGVNESGEVQVHVRLAPGFSGAAMVGLGRYGFRKEFYSASMGLLQGWVPVSSLTALADAPGVMRLTTPRSGRTLIGSVTSEGDAALLSNVLRNQGLDGSGVRIGVIADGAENLAAAQASGDLSAVQILAGCNSGNATDGLCDEGTALLEIVHDIAPGATLAFCGGSVGAPNSVEFIDCAERLSGDEFNADIIVDDISFAQEPMLEDGPVARGVQEIVEKTGVIWVSAAGNNGNGTSEQRQYYSADYVPVGGLRQISGNSYASVNDFGFASTRNSASPISDPRNVVRIAPKKTIRVVLQWSSPYDDPQDDYDLYLLNAKTDAVVAFSNDVQDGDHDAGQIPVETLVYRNESNEYTDLALIVAAREGAQVRRLKLFACYLDSSSCNLSYANDGGQIYGHPAMPGVIAVGAINVRDSGLDEIDERSSIGPVLLVQPTAVSRLKPDIVAVDHVSVSGAGGFPKNFAGTSAAAPHVAAILALLKQGRPAVDVRSAILMSAHDLGMPGPDNVYGAGRVDAVEANKAIIEGRVDDVAPPPANDDESEPKVSAGSPLALLALVIFAVLGGVAQRSQAPGGWRASVGESRAG